MNNWKMPFGGLLINHKKYVLGIIVWAISTYFVILSVNHFYGKHMLLITFLVSGLGWFITIIWMLLSSNKIQKPIEKPRPKFDNPIHEALYDSLKELGEKKDSKRQNLREDAQ